jgi:CheY-like chemotaxis protein
MELSPVLLVDDDRHALEALALLLKYSGIETVTADDGERALQLLRDGLHPCLIVLDLMMPGKDGFAFRAEQLADAALADIPVIVCSAAFDTRGAAARLNATAYIEKPVEARELLRLIRQHTSPIAI